jgi:hypothetical protein
MLHRTPLFGFKGEFLSTNTGIEHQATPGLGKHGNPLVEIGIL